MVATRNGENAEPRIWHSGDWETPPRKEVPYNGTEITGMPTYDANGKFASAEIVVADYTYAKEGVQSRIPAMTIDESWVEIPAVDKPGSPPVADSRFTVKGTLRLRRGSGGMLLGVDFVYGLDGQRHEELGFVFGFPAASEVGAEKGNVGSAP